MAQSLEQYIAEATNAYKPAQTAIQTQIDALGGNLSTATDTINRNYAQQQSQLENQRNQAAEASSLAAAGSGGSFGGQGNLARRKYYERSFVPAQTQLQTNQANELAKAQQEYQNQLANLNAQKASLESQANQQALQQYWAAVEAEKQREAQQRAAAAQNAAQNEYMRYLMNAAKNNTAAYSLSADRNMYGGFDWLDANGNAHTLATVAAAAAGGATSGDAFNKSLYQLAQQAANQGDYYSQELVKQMNNGVRYAKGASPNTKSNALKTLNLNVTSW